MLWFGLSFGQSQYEVLESKLSVIEFNIDSLTAIEKKNASLIDSLSVQISALKAKKRLGYLKRRNLENLLKESQALSQNRQSIQAEISTNNRKRNELASQIIELCSSVIDSLLNHLNQTSSIASNEEKAKIFHQMQTLRARRDFLMAEVILIPHRVPKEISVEILPSDTPREIEEKADYLKDQEDKLRREAVRLSVQIKELRTEADLRLRVSELMDDLRLFDQSEEPMSPSEVANALTKTESMGRTYWSNTPIDIAEKSASNLLPAIEQLRPIDLSQINSDEIDEWISIIESQSQKLLNQADSLGSVAGTYREQAKRLRESKSFKP